MTQQQLLYYLVCSSSDATAIILAHPHWLVNIYLFCFSSTVIVFINDFKANIVIIFKHLFRFQDFSASCTPTAISPPPLCPHYGSTTTTSYPSKTITTITFLTTYSTTWYTRTSSTGIFYSIQKQTLVRSHVHCYFKIYTKIIIHLEKYSSTISGTTYTPIRI